MLLPKKGRTASKNPFRPFYGNHNNVLLYANQLLRDPKRSISEVSRMIGYNDPRYFFKVYKKYEGISPGEYRKQAHMQFSENAAGENQEP